MKKLWDTKATVVPVIVESTVKISSSKMVDQMRNPTENQDYLKDKVTRILRRMVECCEDLQSINFQSKRLLLLV